MCMTISSVSQLRLVALNTPLSGNLGSIHSVNKLCRTQAQAMGIRDDYKAFLSHHLQDLIDVVQPMYRTNIPIVNLRVKHLYTVFFFHFEFCILNLVFFPHFGVMLHRLSGDSPL